MAIIASELKYFKSVHESSDSNNTLGDDITSLGGAITATELSSGTMHDLFDAVPSTEATSGRTEYRCIYVRNTNASQTLYAAKAYIATNTASPDSTFEIALDPAGINADSTILLADELDTGALLSGLSFVPAADFANGIVIGDMAATEYHAVWVKRIINPGAAAAAEVCTLALRGDTDA